MATNKVTSKMKRIAIYDMDGTIVDSTHRYRINSEGKIDLEYWRENEHKAMFDSLLPLADQYKSDLIDSNVFVIIATARILNQPDLEFIDTVLGKPDYMISRKSGDTRSGALLKVLGLKKLFSLKQFSKIRDIIFYEDNHSYLKAVCDYFKCKGMYIPSEQGH